MPRRALPMSPRDARLAVKTARPSVARAVHVRCMTLLAPSAEIPARFLSSRMMTVPFIAAIASAIKPAAKMQKENPTDVCVSRVFFALLDCDRRYDSLFSVPNTLAVTKKDEVAVKVGAIKCDVECLKRIQNGGDGMTVFIAFAARDCGQFGRDGFQKSGAV